MDIVLPIKKGEETDKLVSGVINMVVVGANGAGKSRFGSEIEKRYGDKTFRISALKSVMPLDEKPYVKENSISGEYNKYFGDNNKLTLRTEFEQLFALLIREEMQNLIDYKNALSRGVDAHLKQSTLDKTQIMWEKIFPHHRIVRSNGRLEIVSDTSTDNYNAMKMSNGEKVVLYLIAASLIAKPNSIIIVDEPEMHLHPSMTSSLWDDIESQRPDCCFVYLTHDLNFAVSRRGKRIWVKSYDADTNSFDYEFIENSEALPEDIYLELLGGRKPVLFVEGDTTSSIDNRLYPLVFTDYTVKPLGGCSKVIEVTRAFSEMKNFHMLESRGIVDRDRRTSHEVEYLRSKNIYVPNVAEVENLMMIEPVVRAVARSTGNNEDQVFTAVKQGVIKFFKASIEEQALIHTRHRIRNGIEFRIDTRANTIDEFAYHIEHLTEEIDTRFTYNKLVDKFKRFVREENYPAILKFFNQKAMINQSRVAALCGFSTPEQYINYVLFLLRKGGAESEVIRQAIKECFNLDAPVKIKPRKKRR